MGYGLQVFNQDGVVIFDSSTIVARLIDVVHTGTQDGSRTFYGHSRVMVVYSGVRYDIWRKSCTPNVVCEGNTIRWSFGRVPATNRSGTQLYVASY